jgi:hypothetical protein
MWKKVYFWLLGPVYRRALVDSEAKIFERLESTHLETFEKRYSEWLDQRVRDEVETRIEAAVKNEVDRRMALFIKINMKFQEKFTAKFVDSIVGVHLEMEKLSAFIGVDERPASEEITDEQIWECMRRLTREAKIPELAHIYGVPIRDVLVWRSKYHSMDARTIGIVRKLERENLKLKVTNDDLTAADLQNDKSGVL